MNCTTACQKKVDIAIALDFSKNVGEKNFIAVTEFLENVVRVITVSPNKARVGVIVFSTFSRIRIKLNQYTKVANLTWAILMLHYTKGVIDQILCLMWELFSQVC